MLAKRPDTVAYLIAGHGLYAWGRDMAEARRHTVALEHLLTYELEKMKVRR
jgi:methylthioribulose-1-phosphate dehydratase